MYMKAHALVKRGESGQSQPFWISAVASIALLVGVIVLAILIHRCIKAKRRQRHTMMLDQASQEGSSSNRIDTIDPAGRVIQADEEQGVQAHGALQEKTAVVTANNNPSIVTNTNTKPLAQQKMYRLSQLLSLCSHNSISQQPKTTPTAKEKEKPCLADPQQIQTPSPASNRNHHHPHEIHNSTTVTTDPNETQQSEAQNTDQQHLDHPPSSPPPPPPTPPPLPPRSMKCTTNNDGTWKSNNNALASFGRKSVASVQWVGFRGSMDHRPHNDQLFVVNQDDVV
ncbi:predicted protein [Lichtheimia corymbifera JMRC:FSU:9682]|uniref:Uncharacterized protein n=1 Tax=Lichtheimia corymbifera JMRC:FSU:9682 TaxID=1263082 RepID=A0A068SC14_9FUNG|nr:predicted protein [Lichtheimia corymbifera JMRC:FSU:9682]